VLLAELQGVEKGMELAASITGGFNILRKKPDSFI
jgi:hypothetical protein